MELAEALNKLASLHEAGLLTHEEFAAAKQRLLEPGAVQLPDAEGDVGADRGRGRPDRGWYVDPVRGGAWERFWAGANWTPRLRRRGHIEESSSPLRGRVLDPPRTEMRRYAWRVADQAPVPGSAGTNGLAIASLVLGIVWLSPLAILFGYIARRQILESRGAQTGDGIAVAGMVLGDIGLALWLLALLVVLG